MGVPYFLWTATVDYGDESGIQPLNLYADNSFELNHIYATPGTFELTVTVTDGEGASGVFESQVTVD
ncbi:MAG: PKD domain-containing protein [Desulfobulbaceae bacterium]|nr:PKD domain-containing protein [Desulfobulbaceae bacterium]